MIEKKIIHHKGKVGHIEDIVISNEYRNQGLGKMLIEFLINRAKEEKCYKIILNCQEQNIPFYAKCNFIKKEYQMVQYF